MADIYVQDPETKKIIGCISFSPSEFENIRNISRLIGDVGVHIFNIVSGMDEYFVVQKKDIHIIH